MLPSAGSGLPSRSRACTPRRSPGAGLARRRGPCGPPLQRKPAHARFGVQSSTRMSSCLYTTPAEIGTLVDGLEYTCPLQVGADASQELDARCTQRSSWTTTRTRTTRPARALRGGGAPQANPTCGDEVTLRRARRPGRGGRVVPTPSAAWISQASASVLADFRRHRRCRTRRYRSTRTDLKAGRHRSRCEDVLEDGIAFAGVQSRRA